MNKKVFILLSFLIVLISVSAVSAVDLDDNNETVVTSEIGEKQLSVSQDVNAIDDLNEDDADSDAVLENTVKSSVAGEKEILGVRYTAEGDSDSDVLSEVLIPVRLNLEINKLVGEYINRPDWPSIYGSIYDTRDFLVTRGTLSAYINGELKGTAGPDNDCFEVYLGPLAAGTYTIRAVYHDDSRIYDDGEFTRTITIGKAGTKITIQQDSIELDVGDKISTGATLSTFEERVLPGNITITGLADILSPSEAGPLIYSSSDTEVAEVVNNSIVAKKAGSATITVSYNGNQNYTAAENKTIKVIVKDPRTPTSIDIANSTVELKANGEIAASATLTPADAGNVTYTSSNSSVAVVENGKIKALAAGNANITVSFAGDDTYAAAENKTIEVTVTLNDASVSVNNATLNLIIDNTFTINPTTNPEGLDVTFTPDNSGVVSVDENGVVTALKEGEASIIVSVGGDGVYAPNSTTVTITVSKIPTKINVLNDTLVLRVLDEVATGASLTPAGAGNLTYTSNTPSIVEVKDGKLVAVGEGFTLVIVSYEGDDKYKAATSEIIEVIVTLNDASVSVNNDTLDLLVKDTFDLVATTDPEGLNVSYLSTNESVAVVDSEGKVTAVGVGNATVVVTAGDGIVYAVNSTNVTVTVKIPTEISVENSTVDLKVNGEIAAGASLTPADAGNVTYTSSNSSVAIVKDGKIIAVGAGSANITVSFAGDDTYAAAENKTIEVTVTLNDASVSVNNATLDLIIDDEFIIVPVTAPEGLDVTFTPDNSGVVSVDENGVVTALKEGEASVKVSVGGDGVYALNTTDVSVTVSKIPTKINVLNDTLVLEALDEVADAASLTPAGAGNVTYTSNAPGVVEVKDGKLVAVGGGTAVVIVSFAGDDKYEAAESKNVTVTVSKIASKFTNVGISGNNVTLILKDAFENPISGANISYTINGVSKTAVSDANGSFVIVGEPESEIIVDYVGSEKFMPTNITLTLNDLKPTVRSASKFNITDGTAINTYTVDFNVGERGNTVAFRLTDDEGNPITNATVGFAYKTVYFNRTTDENGIVSIGISTQIFGEYLCALSYLGDETHNAAFVAFYFNIQPKPIKIVASAKTFKSSVKTKKYTITLKTGPYNSKDGKTYLKAGKKVTLKINGKTYTAKTNSKGQATFKITKLTKKGKFTAKISFAGDKTYKAATKSIKITIK